jgi:hypothetical protein
MGQLQKVSWRAVGYAALGTALAAGSVVAIINSDGVRPISLTSSAATRWLVDRLQNQVVLVDGLAGRVVAKVKLDAETGAGDDTAVQGPGGAFLVAPSQGSVRTISTAKLSLGTAQTVGLLSEPGAQFRVGTSGLTILSPNTRKASVVTADDVTQQIAVPASDNSFLAADGSMWLLSKSEATHVSVDETRKTIPLSSTSDGRVTTTVGPRAVTFISASRTLRWLGGTDVRVDSLPNPSEAVIQEPGDDASCAWIGSGDTLLCVGTTSVEHTLEIAGMGISSGDKLAIAGTAAVIVRGNRTVDRIDLEGHKMANDKGAPTLSAKPIITASGNLIWLDEPKGTHAWVVHRFGINTITKDDLTALTFDAQGQVQDQGNGGNGTASGGNGGAADEANHFDTNGHEDPPVAVADSVTARADITVTIPVTGNDYDPDNEPIAVQSAGIGKKATHGTVDVLNGTSVAYKPEPGFSGSDSFDYTIVDPSGQSATATVNVQLFPPGSPNQPPIARPDPAKTRIGRGVTIDVLANDIDPERDVLSISTFSQSGSATITETEGPTGLPALRYVPPPTAGIYTFTYQAADLQGGTSPKTKVTVEVSGADAVNDPPSAVPDSIRLPVGVPAPLDVKANDTDPDGDELTISLSTTRTPGIDVTLQGQQLRITVQPSASELSLVLYTLSDGIKEHDQTGKVLVLRIGDTAENRPPVANADAEKVLIGNSVRIPVTANDLDPDHDPLRVLTAGPTANGAGTTTIEGNSVRFTPNLPDISEPTAVSFNYTITDGHGHDAVGKVTVTVLLEALPRAPFARDDFADTEVDKPVNIDVLANDGDPSGGGQPNLTGDPACPNGGDARRTADDRVTYVPPKGQIGTFRCRYTVINLQGRTSEASIIVTVTEAPARNHIPVIDTSKILTVKLGETLPIYATDIASDADATDHLVFVSVDSPLNGKTEIRQNGDSFLYTAPSATSAEKTPTGDTVTFTISDGHDGNVPGSVSIKIDDPSPPTTSPTAPAAPQVREISKVGVVGEPTQVDVVAELKEANLPSTLTLGAVVIDSGPASSAPVSNNVVTVTPTAPGSVVLGYTVTNSEGGSASSKIRINVNDVPQNPPPVANDDIMIVPSGGSNSIDLLANDGGYADTGDHLNIILNKRPPASFGSVDLQGSQLTFVALPNAAGTVVLTYTLGDGSGFAVGNITIVVRDCADSPPSTSGDPGLFTPYQTPISIDLNQYVLSGSIRSVGGAQLTGATGVYTPPAGFNGVETVHYTVANGCQQTTEGTVTIDVNHSPEGGTIARELTRGNPPLVLRATDLAFDQEPLTITALSGNPGWVNLLPPGTGGNTLGETVVSAAPSAATPSGVYTFTATVEDPGQLTATAHITLTITNLAPTAVADQLSTEESLISFDPTANDFDPEGDLLCVQTVGNPDNGSTVSVPDVSCAKSINFNLVHGETKVSYTVRDDPGGLTSSSTITIISNRPPTVPDATGATNGEPTVEITLKPTEPDGDRVSVTCNTPADGDGPNNNFLVDVSFNPNGGTDPAAHPQFTLIVSVQQPFTPGGPDAEFHCTVTDPFGKKAVATVRITIN